MYQCNLMRMAVTKIAKSNMASCYNYAVHIKIFILLNMFIVLCVCEKLILCYLFAINYIHDSLAAFYYNGVWFLDVGREHKQSVDKPFCYFMISRLLFLQFIKNYVCLSSVIYTRDIYNIICMSLEVEIHKQTKTLGGPASAKHVKLVHVYSGIYK